MARERMVTRTVTVTEVKALCMDIKNAKAVVKEYTLTGRYPDEAAVLSHLQGAYNTADFVVVALQEVKTSEKLFGMTEADFFRLATPLDHRFQKI